MASWHTHPQSSRAPRLANVAKLGRDDDPVTRAEVLKSRGNFQIKSYKGQPYASSWPRRRGHPKSDVQNAWIAWFSCQAYLSKIPHPNVFNTSTDIAKRTGWYYRDVLTAAAGGTLWKNPGEKKVTTPTVSLHRTSSQALTSGVALKLTPDVADWDTNQFWSSSLNPTRMTF